MLFHVIAEVHRAVRAHWQLSRCVAVSVAELKFPAVDVALFQFI